MNLKNYNMLNKIILGQKIKIKYLEFGNFLEREGMIIKIDRKNCLLYLPNIIIPFANIIMIKACKI